VTGREKCKQSWFRRAFAADDRKNLRNPVHDPHVAWQATDPSVTWDPWELWLKQIEQPRRQRDR
jgi:hypothetical protein